MKKGPLIGALQFHAGWDQQGFLGPLGAPPGLLGGKPPLGDLGGVGGTTGFATVGSLESNAELGAELPALAVEV